MTESTRNRSGSTTSTERESTSARTGMLERAMTLLSAFRPNEVTVSPTTLAKRAGLSKATGHRIVAEMVNLGMLERTVGGVRIGLRMFEIGQLVPRQRSLRRCAMPVMQELRDNTKLSVHLAVLDHGDTLYVDIVSKRQDLPSAVGGRIPAYATGVGKAMLAFSPSDVVSEVMSKRLKRYGPNTITDTEALRAELAEIRAEGVSYDREESSRGVACVAAPIRGGDGMLHGGISLTGHVAEIDYRRLTPIVQTAARIVGRRIEQDVVAQQEIAEAMLQATGPKPHLPNP
ncbi:IclR family transcriptional regulator [Gulosibacter chungangensis]|uniref:IclR family transcriptional regulator n=1 Tax=Gulosibacter chungangensis TaxID=979746 RepID=A0A7J5BDD0_9MICO|nr:IclR family transcriptional regulator [Gulosibacter chungangensis]KAB1644228.1 IclR family transcriptional regulator [Gulosibacter chungangensis]